MEEQIRLKSSTNDEVELHLRKSFNKGKIGTDKLVYQSLKQLGCGRGILVDRNNIVISGNKTIEAASKLGVKIKIVECNADELVVVKRTDVDFDSRIGYELSLTDNLIPSKTLEWDTDEVLNAMKKNLSFDPRVWNGQECVVKELNIADLLNDETNVKLKNTQKVSGNTNSFLQLSLFE